MIWDKMPHILTAYVMLWVFILVEGIWDTLIPPTNSQR